MQGNWVPVRESYLLPLYTPKTVLELSLSSHEPSTLQEVSECPSSVSHRITERSIWDHGNWSGCPGTQQRPSRPLHTMPDTTILLITSQNPPPTSGSICILLCALSLTHSFSNLSIVTWSVSDCSLVSICSQNVFTFCLNWNPVVLQVLLWRLLTWRGLLHFSLMYKSILSNSCCHFL